MTKEKYTALKVRADALTEGMRVIDRKTTITLLHPRNGSVWVRTARRGTRGSSVHIYAPDDLVTTYVGV